MADMSVCKSDTTRSAYIRPTINLTPFMLTFHQANLFVRSQERRHVKEVKGGSDERHLLSDWVKGDVFAAVGDGKYNVFSNNGVFKETIDTGLSGFYTTGCAFNQDRSKLFTTVFDASKVVVFDMTHPHSILQTIDASPGGGTESIIFDSAGNFFVGHAYGDKSIRKYNASGTFLESYSAALDIRGTDWIDLATDQCTLFYTSLGRLVKRFDVCTNTQLTDFATLPGTGYAYTFRLLPPGDGTGGLLVADYNNIKRLNGTGNVVQTYDSLGEDNWFSLNLDPDGTTFWSGDFFTRNFYRFEITSGNTLGGPFTSGGSFFFGICLLGEVTAASTCGNGIVQTGEQCDDGNTVDGDGCSSTCQLEINNCTITYNLYNSKNETLVAPLTNGTVVASPPPCRRLNIEAMVPCANGSNVTLELYRDSRLAKWKFERTSPYFLFGNQGRNVLDGKIVPGSYGIRARVASGAWSPFTNFTLGGRCD
jgi:cysteine-rich repeat protein